MPEKPPAPFLPVRIAVLTVSDSRDLSTDTSGDALVARIAEAGHELADRTLVRDDAAAIEAVLRGWIARPQRRHWRNRARRDAGSFRPRAGEDH